MEKFEIAYRSNRNVVYSCIYHCVWCPKYRRPVITGQVEVRLKFDAELIEMEVMPDHVHLLLQIDPQLGIHRLIKNIKGKSSRLLRGEFREIRSRLPTLWTNSYFVATNKRGSSRNHQAIREESETCLTTASFIPFP